MLTIIFSILWYIILHHMLFIKSYIRHVYSTVVHAIYIGTIIIFIGIKIALCGNVDITPIFSLNMDLFFNGFLWCFMPEGSEISDQWAAKFITLWI